MSAHTPRAHPVDVPCPKCGGCDVHVQFPGGFLWCPDCEHDWEE